MYTLNSSFIFEEKKSEVINQNGNYNHVVIKLHSSSTTMYSLWNHLIDLHAYDFQILIDYNMKSFEMGKRCEVANRRCQIVIFKAKNCDLSALVWDQTKVLLQGICCLVIGVTIPCSCRVAANNFAAAFHVTCYASMILT